jgi:transcriptional regulator with XRE-family HTH domain
MMSLKNNTAELEAQVRERIWSRRFRVGMSQANLGKPLGVTFQQIQKYERCANRITAGPLPQIAEIFHVPISTLFKGYELVNRIVEATKKKNWR